MSRILAATSTLRDLATTNQNDDESRPSMLSRLQNSSPLMSFATNLTDNISSRIKKNSMSSQNSNYTSNILSNNKLFRNHIIHCDEQKKTRTSNDYYAATNSDFDREWNWDWDGKHPADADTIDWMHGRNSKSSKSSSDSDSDGNPALSKPCPKHTVRHIFLMRHGQYNLSDDGQSELTDLGRLQAKKTGEKLKAWSDGLKKDKYGEIKIKWKRVTSSNLLRAKQTADIVAEVLGTKVEEYDPVLNEGTPCLTNPSSTLPEDMKTKESLPRHLSDPPRIEAAFRKYVNRKINWKKAKRKAEEKYICDMMVKDDSSKSGGKDGGPVINESYAPEIAGKDNKDEKDAGTGGSGKKNDDEDKTVHEYELIICHMNVIRYFVVRALQMPPESWLRFRGDNCGLTELIIYDTGNVSLGRFGDQGHLKIEETTFH